MLNIFRKISGFYNIISRRELLDKFAGRSWQIGPEVNLNYAPPAVYGGAVPLRMLEFARPLSLEAPFVCEIPDVELVGDTAIPVLRAPNKTLLSFPRKRESRMWIPRSSRGMTELLQSRGALLLGALKGDTLFYDALPCGDEKELLSASLRLKKKVKVDAEYDTAFCLIKPHSRGYFHWIMDCLLCLEGYVFYCKETGTKPVLLVDKELTPFQRDSLELMDYTEKDCVHWNAKRAKVKKLVVASLRRRSEKAGVPFDAISPSALGWLRKRILAGLDAKGGRGASGNIFISRSKAATRRVLNEDELMSLLAPLGFKSYCLEDLSFSEQVKLFACAKTIVGTHGSGLTNMVWADPGARIIELMPENRLHPDYFQLSRALGHSYAALICKAPAGGSDITVNLAEFRKCLKGFI